jgi:hypothetical protein
MHPHTCARNPFPLKYIHKSPGKSARVVTTRVGAPTVLSRASLFAFSTVCFVLSAARAYSASGLTEAARRGAPGFVSGIYGAQIWNTPAPHVFHTLFGVRPSLVQELRRQLGCRLQRLGELR